MEPFCRPMYRSACRFFFNYLFFKHKTNAHCSFNVRSYASSNNQLSSQKKKLVFLGSPSVAAGVLERLLDASKSSDSVFEVSAVVTQPASGKSRGKKQRSPVAIKAVDMNFPADRIFVPERAGDEAFLADLRAMRPDLCVTAAYGNILPKRFLEIPYNGTVNIHPSLLPLYRGAAPVQRALEDGVSITGVSLAFTVYALDSGPIIGSEELEIDDNIKAPELLAILFDRGTNILLRELPSILNGAAAQEAKEQDHSKASYAPKTRNDDFLRLRISIEGVDVASLVKESHYPFWSTVEEVVKVSAEESWLSFDQTASVLHNKVRAFAGWPGTRTKVQTFNQKGEIKILELKIVTTRVGSKNFETNDPYIEFDGEALLFCCGDGSTLEVIEVQVPGKKLVSARDFWNGLCGRKLLKA